MFQAFFTKSVIIWFHIFAVDDVGEY